MFVYLTFLIRMDLSFRASSWERILRSRILRDNTRFSEFLMWCSCSRLISLSIPLDCIFLCIKNSAWSRLLFLTFTLMPRHCCSSQFSGFRATFGRLKMVDTCFITELIISRVSRFCSEIGAFSMFCWENYAVCISFSILRRFKPLYYLVNFLEFKNKSFQDQK